MPSSLGEKVFFPKPPSLSVMYALTTKSSHFFAAEQHYFIEGLHPSAAKQSKTYRSEQSAGNKFGSPTSLGYILIDIGCGSKDKNSLFWSASKAFQNSHSSLQLLLDTKLSVLCRFCRSAFLPLGLRSHSASQRLPFKPVFHLGRRGEKGKGWSLISLCLSSPSTKLGRYRADEHHTHLEHILDSSFHLWSCNTALAWI